MYVTVANNALPLQIYTLSEGHYLKIITIDIVCGYIHSVRLKQVSARASIASLGFILGYVVQRLVIRNNNKEFLL